MRERSDGRGLFQMDVLKNLTLNPSPNGEGSCPHLLRRGVGGEVLRQFRKDRDQSDNIMENKSQSIILVVDDNPGNLGILFDYLDQAGFTVLLVQDSENAVKQAEDNIPDVILLDVMMPGLSGFEVCQHLKANARTAEIPVIFMTALTDTLDKVKGFDVGGVDYITKPIQHEEVLARVHAHLTIRRLQQELRKKNRVLEQYVTLLEEKNLELQTVNASKDRFFSIISHDLRTPFIGLQGLTQVLAEHFDDYTPDEIKHYIVKLHESSENFYALLANLLTWSRSQRGMIEHHPQPVELRELIKQNMAIFSPIAEQKQLTLNNLLREPLSVYADQPMAETVLRNLLSNAVKFSRPGGAINISAIRKDQHVEISVADSGIGIGQEHLPKLFRIDVTYKRIGTANERGTGLGLILCKEFVEKNGGIIWVESEVGKGTTFTFTLPVIPENQSALA